MRNIPDKNCSQNQNTHFISNNSPPRKSCRLWNNVWKNAVQPDMPQMTMQYGACALHAG